MERVADLDTPSVLVDLDALDRNIAAMAAVAERAGIALRPHMKTHQSPDIARRQLAAGAVGLACAKVSEAEAMADAGILDLFVCFPIVTAVKAWRLAALARRPGVTLSAIADSPTGVAALSAAFAPEARPLEVLVKVDTGLGRVGVAPGEPALALARAVAAAPGLRFGGVCAHEGGAYSVTDPTERAAVTRAAVERLIATAHLIEAAGLPCPRVSVGSTPGAVAAAGVAGVTELRPGNYVFYDAMQVWLGVATVDDCALRVLATVVSHGARERAVIDAGSKVFSADRGVHGAATAASHGIVLGQPAVTLAGLSEEHGWLRLDPAGPDLAIGQQLEIVPVHSCPVANLATELVVVRRGVVLDRWRPTAHGSVR
ncbi:MAG: alanine racemase [Chloroflexi bacterium]|nr:alanine racemase [Chloroflexota bacterium]